MIYPRIAALPSNSFGTSTGYHPGMVGYHQLVGGCWPPLWKIWVNWDDDINPIFLGNIKKWQPFTTNQLCFTHSSQSVGRLGMAFPRSCQQISWDGKGMASLASLGELLTLQKTTQNWCGALRTGAQNLKILQGMSRFAPKDEKSGRDPVVDIVVFPMVNIIGEMTPMVSLQW